MSRSTEEREADREWQEAQAKVNAAAADSKRREAVRAVCMRLDALRLAVLEVQTDPDMPDDRLTAVLTDYKGQFLAAVSDLRALRYGTDFQDKPDPVLPFGLRDLSLTGHAEWDGLDDMIGKRATNPRPWREPVPATSPDRWDFVAAA